MKMSYTFSLHVFSMTIFEEIIEFANFIYNTVSLNPCPSRNLSTESLQQNVLD